MKNKSQKLGDKGEALAAKYLMDRSYELLAHHVVVTGGELDLVMFDPAEECFVLVEVKTRTNDTNESRYSSVNKAKFQRTVQAGEKYFLEIEGYDEVPPLRVDIVLVQYLDQKFYVEHFPNINPNELR